MHITNAVGQTPTFSVNNKTNTLAKPSERVFEPVTNANVDYSQANKKVKPSIIIDEQAIALFEQQKPQIANTHFTSTDQDKPSAQNKMAVASYQAVDNIAQRESVQQLFGVDLFA
ncbi:MAG: hypothetical protein JJV99_10645 [Colwellia sp.]|nr:hypothetical protein [Colwellia sp.]